MGSHALVLLLFLNPNFTCVPMGSMKGDASRWRAPCENMYRGTIEIERAPSLDPLQ